MTSYTSDDGHPRRWIILAVMCASLVLVVAGVSSLNLALPSIRDALLPSNTELLWIVDSYVLVFAGLLLPAGAIGDEISQVAPVVGRGNDPDPLAVGSATASKPEMRPSAVVGIAGEATHFNQGIGRSRVRCVELRP